MSDHTPNILVDNQKLQLISRRPASGAANTATFDLENGDFDVVDRVTISDAARERYRRYEDSLKVQTSRHRIDAGTPAAAVIRPSQFPKTTP